MSRATDGNPGFGPNRAQLGFNFAIVENGDGDDFHVTNVICKVRALTFVINENDKQFESGECERKPNMQNVSQETQDKVDKSNVQQQGKTTPRSTSNSSPAKSETDSANRQFEPDDTSDSDEDSVSVVGISQKIHPKVRTLGPSINELKNVERHLVVANMSAGSLYVQYSPFSPLMSRLLPL